MGFPAPHLLYRFVNMNFFLLIWVLWSLALVEI
jgi:hypothetical protein